MVGVEPGHTNCSYTSDMGDGTEIWAVLWSGAVGSFIAAVLGGLVALAVVRLTNRHQSRLAAESREKAAISELVAAASWLLPALDEEQPNRPSILRVLEAAVVRWTLELEHVDMRSELQVWPHHLVMLATRLDNAEAASADQFQAFIELSDAVQEIRRAALCWHRTDRAGREELVKGLRAYRQLVFPEPGPVIPPPPTPRPQ